MASLLGVRYYVKAFLTFSYGWNKQPATFSQKSAQAKNILCSAILTWTVFFNQAVIRILEQIQICFPEEMSISAHNMCRPRGWASGLSRGTVCQKAGSCVCLPMTCMQVKGSSSQIPRSPLGHSHLAPRLRPPSLPCTISSRFSVSYSSIWAIWTSALLSRLPDLKSSSYPGQ